MNERIKELAEQAEMSANQGDHVDVKIMIEKFSELIVEHFQPKREPLTDEDAEKIIHIYDGGNSDVRNAMRGLKRAIEAAHGIKE